MFNFVMFALAFLSGFPKPDLVSVDIGSVQAGAGFIFQYNNNPLLFPDAGISLGQARLYWGKTLAVMSGLELLHATVSTTDRPSLFVTSAFLKPQLGVSFLFRPERQFRSGKEFLGSKGYIPRLDIVLGFTPLNLVLWDSSPVYWGLSPTLTTEASFYLTHTMRISFENQNMVEYDTAMSSWLAGGTPYHTYRLALSYAFGADYTDSTKVSQRSSTGFPEPDLFSFDVGTFQIGAGIAPDWPGSLLLPDIGVSLGQARLHWGKSKAFVAGFELLRFELAGSPETGLFGTSECFMPEIGLSKLLKSERPVKSKACIGLFKSESFVPRTDLVCGFSAINPVLSFIKGNPVNFSPTLRFEARIFLNRTIQIIFENRNIWCYDESYEYLNTYNTFHLSLCFAMGADYPANKSPEPEREGE